MYKLYIANKNYSSWSLRPWVLMSELGIPFEEHLVAFSEKNNWDEFRKFSPTGLVPCLSDNETLVWESLAIVEYLAEKHSEVWPENSSARAWARSATVEMHAGFSAIRNQCPMTCGQRIKMHEIDSSLQKDLDRLAELWIQGLEKFGGPFLAGNLFTAVDAFFCPIAFRAQSYGLSLGDLPDQYIQRLLSMASMQDWYEAGLKEPWRDKGHEEEIAATGEIVADYRAAAV
ncbi:MAG: glutathione S-transferase family protein [Porticoccaceae bacterium]|jgi:glutathione S-transferase|nr:glutathione S-transferase family protein [Porticoccaceae bacterium]